MVCEGVLDLEEARVASTARCGVSCEGPNQLDRRRKARNGNGSHHTPLARWRCRSTA